VEIHFHNDIESDRSTFFHRRLEFPGLLAFNGLFVPSAAGRSHNLHVSHAALLIYYERQSYGSLEFGPSRVLAETPAPACKLLQAALRPALP